MFLPLRKSEMYLFFPEGRLFLLLEAEGFYEL
jgi:hypothetical protein